MNTFIKYIFLSLILISCKENKTSEETNVKETHDVTIAFGSCNRQTFENKLWPVVMDNNPSVWIWGGDIIYSDTEDMEQMANDYKTQLAQKGYEALTQKTKIMGTWDDHDYGLNDGGAEFAAKTGSQQLFLDFIGVPKDDPRRSREGVYHSELLTTEKGTIKIIILDARYFRTALTPSENPEFRYQPNAYGEGTMLGEVQWQWLEDQLNSSEADFNIIMSSIQFLSGEHGFESWSNMPHEVDKLKQLISASKAKGVIVLSGDRHISEFSKTTLEQVSYPLIDFTSSGMTHSYESFDGEPNKFREGKVVPKRSFGVLKFDFETKEVTMQMIGEDAQIQQELIQKY